MSDISKKLANLTPEMREKLAQRLKQQGGLAESSRNASIPKRAKAENYPLSFAQQRMYFLDQLTPHSSLYNEPLIVLALNGELDLAALEQSLNEIVRRHETLRTTFQEAEGGAVQVILPPSSVALRIEDLTGDAAAQQRAELLAKEEASRPFDLSGDALLRVTLVKLGASEHRLFLARHHIISDGWSSDVLLRELSALYTAFAQGQTASLPEPEIQYADYAVWQREQEQETKEDESLAFWKERLSGRLPLLELPSDRPRPAVRSYQGGTYPMKLNKAQAERLQAISRASGTTLFMTALSLFQTWLHRYTGQEDLWVGTPVANRQRTEVEGLIGFFVNTLVLRTDLSGEPTFSELLQRTKKTVLDAIAHQETPLEKLVEVLKPERAMSHNPLFQVLFVLQKAPEPLSLPNLSAEISYVNSDISRFDMTLSLVEHWDGDSLELGGWLQYNTDLFDHATIDRMVKHFHRLLDGVTVDQEQKINALPLLLEEEKARLLTDWQGAAQEFETDALLHVRVAQLAEQHPDRTAVVCEDAQLTYRELNEQANRLAAHLKTLGVGADVHVGLCLDRSVEQIVAMLAILKAGGAYVPMEPSFPAERLSYLLTNSEVRVLLTTESVEDNLPEHQAHIVRLDADQALFANLSAENPTHEVSGEDAAYVIYTSGSTGLPKGVVIEHRNMQQYTQAVLPRLQVEDGMSFATVSTLAADLGNTMVFAALYTGGTLHVLTQDRVVDAEAMADYMEKHSVDVLKIVPPHMQALMSGQGSRVLPKRRLVFGGDALNWDLVDRIRKAAPELVVINHYGPTETTVGVLTHQVGSNPMERSSRTVPLGRPLGNTEVHLLDERMQPVPVGVPGEVYIGGPAVARGYWGREDLTAERFLEQEIGGKTLRLYKTGDRARRLAEGSIEFLGRMDDQVKIRGYRVEPNEVADILLRHPDVRQAAVLVKDGGQGDKRLVAYVALNGEPNPSLKEFLGTQMPEYLVPSAFVELAELPLTANGKVDRNALPEPGVTEAATETEFVAPSNDTEVLLAEIWHQVMGVERVGANDNFFELGGHSLNAMQVISRIRKAFAIDLPLRTLFEAPTVAKLAEEVQALQKADRKSLPVVLADRNSTLPLSSTQKRLWLLDRMAPGSALYNIPFEMKLEGEWDHKLLEQSLNALIARHEILRTNFVISEDGIDPKLVIKGQATLDVPFLDLSDLAEEAREAKLEALRNEQMEQPMNLAQDLLLRATLVRTGASEQRLVMTIHHIINDEWSKSIIVKELSAFYEGFAAGRTPVLPPLPAQYADYALWQKNFLESEEMEELTNYWTRQMADAPPLLELHLDHARPAVQTTNGASKTFTLSHEVVQGLSALAEKEGVTPYMTLLSVFKALLHRYSNQNDIVVGTPISNRNRTEFESMIGFFVNTLVLRTDLEGEPTFTDLLNRVREVTLGAFAHQEMPFDQLINQLRPDRNTSYSPLFQVMFLMQSSEAPIVTENRTLTPVYSRNGKAAFDLALSMEEKDYGYKASFEYNADLFDADTIELMAGHFQRFAEEVVRRPELPITKVPILSDQELHRQIVEFNQTDRDYPTGLTMHGQFEAAVEKYPDNIAVTWRGIEWTYRELNARANQVAHRLLEMGIEKETSVGISVLPNLHFAVSVLGVMKAGGTYVPLDPAYPSDRLTFMIEDSEVPVILTEASVIESLPETDVMKLCIDSDWETEFARQSTENPNVDVREEDLAYMIFTSGSTGRPKGVQIEHRNGVNIMHSLTDQWSMTPEDRVLQFTSISFDVVIDEIFPTWMNGSTLVLRPDRQLLSPYDFACLVANERINIMIVQTAYLHEWTNGLRDFDISRLDALRVIITGGEKVSPVSYKNWHDLFGYRVLYLNGYGPTETTVTATFYDPETHDDHKEYQAKMPIGRPLENYQIYIVDKYMQPVPVGVVGELVIGGRGVGRGYKNRPDLTAEKFVADPFRPEQGTRIYKSGDTAKFLKDGTIEFVGRVDHQVKIRGYRIEMGEIEENLAKHPEVKDSFVMVREDIPGDKRIVAYATSDTITDGNELRAALRLTLPEFMVPSAILMIDEFPLTPNNKIDRARLPKPDLSAVVSENYAPPRNEDEELIASVWSEVLRIPQIGVYDSFFELGGHSLLGVQVISQLYRKAGVELPLLSIFEAPTVAALAERLAKRREDGSAGLDNALVELQKGEGTPLFLVHPISGYAHVYSDLVAGLPGQTVWGLQARGISVGNNEIVDDLKEMAKIYINAIKQVQPEGPYRLGGWSFGGVIAYEMARQLMAVGEKVEPLVFFDSFAPSMRDQFDNPTVDEIAAHFAKNLFRVTLDEAKGEDNMETILENMLEVVRKDQPSFTKEDMTRLFNVYRAHITASSGYDPGDGIDIDVLFFRAGDAPEGTRNPVEGWTGLVKDITIYDVCGDHYAILLPNYVEAISTVMHDLNNAVASK